jgi:hypothetical protein
MLEGKRRTFEPSATVVLDAPAQGTDAVRELLRMGLSESMSRLRLADGLGGMAIPALRRPVEEVTNV